MRVWPGGNERELATTGHPPPKQTPEGNVLTDRDRRLRESSREKGVRSSPSEACVGIGDAGELTRVMEALREFKERMDARESTRVRTHESRLIGEA